MVVSYSIYDEVSLYFYVRGLYRGHCHGYVGTVDGQEGMMMMMMMIKYRLLLQSFSADSVLYVVHPRA